jgi:hypothetical protein
MVDSDVSATVVLAALERLNAFRISSAKLKKLSGLSALHTNTYSEALKRAMSRTDEWQHVGRSFVRAA